MRCPVRAGQAAGAVLLVAACAGDTVIDHSYHYPVYDLGLARYVIQDRDVDTRVFGPRPGPSTASTAGLLAAMNRTSTWAGKANFTLTPTNARPNYWVAVLLDPDPLTTGEKLCAGQGAAAPRQHGLDGVRLYAAFCYRETPIAEAAGESAAARSPTDPAFQVLVDQLMLALFPLRSPLAPDCAPHQRFHCADAGAGSWVSVPGDLRP